MAEVWRKLYRCLGLIFPIFYFFYAKNIVLTILLILTFIFIIAEILRFNFPIITEKYFKYFSAITKEKEKKSLSGTTYVLIASSLTILLFKKDIAIIVLFFMIIGDSASSLIGQRFGRTKIFNKTLEGSIACFFACFVTGNILLYLGVAINETLIFVGALVATLTELLPLRVDDNLTMALVSGLFMSMVKGV